MENKIEENNNIDSAQKTTGSVGPMIGSIIVILIIIIGGFYFWSTLSDKLNKKPETETGGYMLEVQSEINETENINTELENI